MAELVCDCSDKKAQAVADDGTHGGAFPAPIHLPGCPLYVTKRYASYRPKDMPYSGRCLTPESELEGELANECEGGEYTPEDFDVAYYDLTEDQVEALDEFEGW